MWRYAWLEALGSTDGLESLPNGRTQSLCYFLSVFWHDFGSDVLIYLTWSYLEPVVSV